MYYSPFAKKNWSFTLISMLHWTKGLEWVKVLNALGPLCLWQCLNLVVAVINRCPLLKVLKVRGLKMRELWEEHFTFSLDKPRFINIVIYLLSSNTKTQIYVANWHCFGKLQSNLFSKPTWHSQVFTRFSTNVSKESAEWFCVLPLIQNISVSDHW